MYYLSLKKHVGVAVLLEKPGEVKKALLGMLEGTEGMGSVKSSKLAGGS